MLYIQLPHFLPVVPVEPFAKLDLGVLHLLGLRRPGSQRSAYGLVYIERVELVISRVRDEVGLPYATGYCLDDFHIGKHFGETFPVPVCGWRRCPTGLRLDPYVDYVSREFPVDLRYSGLIVGKYQQG